MKSFGFAGITALDYNFSALSVEDGARCPRA